MTDTKTQSPWQHHMSAGHVGNSVTHVSFDGHSVFEECAICQLCWLLPDVLNRNQYPITIYRYPMTKGETK